MGLDFDLRKRNPKKGDLVLLINRDPETGQPHLLTIFDEFLKDKETANDTAVEIFGESKYRFNAKRLAYLKPPVDFAGISIPDIEHLLIGKDVLYVPDEIHVGTAEVIKALRKEKGYEVYADILTSQSL